MTDDEELIEQVARDIADALGDNFDYAFSGKAEWIAQRGETPAGFRDVNQPYKPDYIDAAIAAIAAMQPRFKAERIRGGEMVREAAAVAYQTEAKTWLQLPARGACSRLGALAIRALSVPAIVEAGEHQPKENTDASSD